MKDHRPPHLFFKECWYFITAHTVGKTPIMVSDAHKNIWSEVLKQLLELFGIIAPAWVLLDDHYHLLCYFNDDKNITKFIQRLHGLTAFQLNRYDQKQGRSVWYNYWDRYIRDDLDYWRRFKYIHYNPVKHGYVDHPEDWQYSSFHQNLSLLSENWMEETLNNNPLRDNEIEAGE